MVTSIWSHGLKTTALRVQQYVVSKQRPALLVNRALFAISRPSKIKLNLVPFRGFYSGLVHQNDPQKLLEEVKEGFEIPAASHDFDTLTPESVGLTVAVHGYLGARSDLSQDLSFVPLLDKSLARSIQVVSNIKDKDDHAQAVHSKLRSVLSNSPVLVQGVIKSKPAPSKPSKNTGFSRIENLEISLTDLTVLNKFPRDINFQSDTSLPPEQRHLQIRQSKDLRHALKTRSVIRDCLRSYLRDDERFTEVDTPLLFKSTPEGAREFLVPTREKGFAYALPQSPQQYKQVLMASGIPRYFQFAKCFRDEDLRADRQPEFMQLDLEMAFASSIDVMKCIEGAIKTAWKAILPGDTLPDEFPVISYADAMAKYGSDKPDVRIGMPIFRIEHLIPADLISKIGPLSNPIVEAMTLRLPSEPQESRKFIADFMDSADAKPFWANPEGQPGIFVYDSRKPLGGLQAFGFEAAERLEEAFALEEGNIIIIQARKDAPFSGGSTPLGDLRRALHKAAVEQDLLEPPRGWRFLWVNQFPLFSPASSTEPGQGGINGIASTHHPFTAPAKVEDLERLASDPLSVTADHYDLVLNGVELGGGSRRIHDAKLQEYILRNVLGMSDERLSDFSHLLEVLRHGCPPHAGIALGFDRLCAVMLGKESIRDVIAFPKTGSGEDPLVKSPSALTAAQLETYHLRLTEA